MKASKEKVMRILKQRFLVQVITSYCHVRRYLLKRAKESLLLSSFRKTLSSVQAFILFMLSFYIPERLGILGIMCVLQRKKMNGINLMMQ